MASLNSTHVRASLRRLAGEKYKLFGETYHDFRLNPCLNETELRRFEASHSITLPGDYRLFLTEISNGGAGPYYGIFPLGMIDGTDSALQPWKENDGFIGKLSEPFGLMQSWNDLTLQPPEELSTINIQEYDRQVEAFDKVYWHPGRMDGAIPICHLGCALRIWLIVTGEQAGYLWRDGRAEYTGISPVLLYDHSQATFSSWYEEWLAHPLPAPF
jgi:hypothetical protein